MREDTEQEDGGARECGDSQGTQSTVLGETLSYRKYEECLGVAAKPVGGRGSTPPCIWSSGHPVSRRCSGTPSRWASCMSCHLLRLPVAAAPGRLRVGSTPAMAGVQHQTDPSAPVVSKHPASLVSKPSLSLLLA